jgi:hypothetical protein
MKPSDSLPTLNKYLEDQEYEYLTLAMEVSHGVVKQAARIAGREPGPFYKKLLDYGIKARDYRGIYHGPEWQAAHKDLPREPNGYFKKQKGFIFGGAYVYLAMALAAAALAAVCYLTGRSDGRALERSEWVSQQNSDLRTANQAIDAAHKKAREQEAQSAQKVAAVSTAYQKDLANANRAKDLALNALRAGGLRVAVTGCQATDGGTGQAAPAAPGRDGGAATGFLAENDAAFLLSEASRADEVTLQLRACQAVIRADRS